MNEFDHFRSITHEFEALKDRVRHFIGKHNWVNDGESKESILRAVLRRYLPQNVGVGKGFVITREGPSSQIDVLLYDRTKPMLYHDGDLVLTTSDACLGIIEVKTKLDSTRLRRAIQKLVCCRRHVTRFTGGQPFTGLFSFEHVGKGHKTLLRHLKTISEGSIHRVPNCVSLGMSLFARYWECPPERPNHPAHIIRVYKPEEMAPAYFVLNVIDYLCERSILDNNHIWYPGQGKDVHNLVGQVDIKKA